MQLLVANQELLQDISEILKLTRSYGTIEPYVDSQFDLLVQKIGNNFRAFKYVSEN